MQRALTFLAMTAVLGVNGSPHTAAFRRRLVPQVPGFEYAGCYTETPTSKALTGEAFVDDLMTVGDCADACAGWKYFGLENSRECYCGNQLNAGSVTTQLAECAVPCPGDSSQNCGALERLDVFVSLTDPTKVEEHDVCYVEPTDSSSSTVIPVSSITTSAPVESPTSTLAEPSVTPSSSSSESQTSTPTETSTVLSAEPSSIATEPSATSAAASSSSTEASSIALSGPSSTTPVESSTASAAPSSITTEPSSTTTEPSSTSLPSTTSVDISTSSTETSSIASSEPSITVPVESPTTTSESLSTTETSEPSTPTIVESSTTSSDSSSTPSTEISSPTTSSETPSSSPSDSSSSTAVPTTSSSTSTLDPTSAAPSTSAEPSSSTTVPEVSSTSSSSTLDSTSAVPTSTAILTSTVIPTTSSSSTVPETSSSSSSSSTALPSPTSVVANGDFEGAGGWTIKNGAPTAVTYSFTNTNTPHSGSYAASVTYSAGAGAYQAWFNQVITLTANTHYTFSAWTRANTANPGCTVVYYIATLDGNTSLKTMTQAASANLRPTWIQSTGFYDATATGQYTLNVRLVCSASAARIYYFDDLSLVAST